MEACLTAKLAPAPSEMFSNLLLLGTVHSDIRGFKKSIQFLNRHEPDVIFLEISPFAKLFRQRHQGSFHKRLHCNLREAAALCGITFPQALKHPEIVAISRQISLPFEFRAARAYARSRKAGVLLVDYSAFSRLWISSWAGLISTENLMALLSMPSRRASTEQAYRTAERRITGKGSDRVSTQMENPGHNGRLWEKREYFMARQIKLAISSLKPRKPIYIGGWWHLTGGGSTLTLRDILMVDPARCYLLNCTGS